MQQQSTHKNTVRQHTFGIDEVSFEVTFLAQFIRSESVYFVQKNNRVCITIYVEYKLPFLTTIYRNKSNKHSLKNKHQTRNGGTICFFFVRLFVCFGTFLLFFFIAYFCVRSLVLCWPQSIAIHAVSFICGRRSFRCKKITSQTIDRIITELNRRNKQPEKWISCRNTQPIDLYALRFISANQMNNKLILHCKQLGVFQLWPKNKRRLLICNWKRCDKHYSRERREIENKYSPNDVLINKR